MKVNNTKMRVLIKTKRNLGYSQEVIKPIAGTWIEVETDHLFHDQYNTVPFKGCVTGARVHDRDIQAVQNDHRVGLAKCGYCGTMLEAGELCDKYRVRNHFELYVNNKSESDCDKYKVKRFTEGNTYFLAHPQGLDDISMLALPNEKKRKIGSYTLGVSYGYFTLSNCHKNFIFKYDTMRRRFYLKNGSVQKYLDIPDTAHFKLTDLIEEITKK